MIIDWLKTADFFQEELQAFYQVFRRGGDKGKLRAAIERLRAAVDQMESMVNDLEGKGGGLTAEQRWGYLRVLSHLYERYTKI
jgi:hypothetical protein